MFFIKKLKANSKKNMNTLSRLTKFMTGRKLFYPLSLGLSAISAVTGMAPYILVWFIVREFITMGSVLSSSMVQTYAWWAAGLAIGSVLIYFAALSFSHLAAFRAECNMRRYAMGKVIKKPLGFFDNNTSGRIRKIIDDNASITHGFLAHQMPDFAATLVMPVVAIVMMFVFDWRLGLACLVPVIIAFSIMSMMMGTKGKWFMQQYMNSLEEMNTEAVEYVRGIPVVKVFQQTVFSFKNFHKSIIKYRDMVTTYTKMWKVPMSAYTVIINSFSFVLVPVSILIIGRTGDIAMVLVDLFIYILVAPVFSQSIMRSMYMNQAFGQAKEAIDRLDNLVATEGLSITENPQTIKRNEISFINVSFAYPGAKKNAVDNVSFKIKKGQTVALVGASGGGKTTIARLVPRFWDVDNGEVCIGDINVKDIDHKNLMDNVSFVFQNTSLFKTTLLENVRYGKPNATLEEVNRAIDLAQCREIINRLNDGLNTKIGTEGTYLSGGEQQRIALARAILKDAPIVVLDEATAFTDPENEHQIQMALGKLSEGKTVLMIAHRLTSVVEANNILVINDGKIAEQGTHKDLVNKNGIYTKMWNEYQQSVKWQIGG